jgi:hypothetical protein
VITTVTVADRPDLAEALWSVPHNWPAYMLEDPFSGVFYSRLPSAFPEYQLLALDESSAAIGKLHTIPFRWEGTDDDLPERGWEAILQRGFDDREAGRTPNAVSFLEALITPALRGTGLSAQLVTAGRNNARQLGFTDVFAPVRPANKAMEPRTPMVDYVSRARADGLPADPWLRVHVRLGARVVKVCPLSMVIPGTLVQWREWTGEPFDTSGLVDVAGALAPVHVSVEQGHAVYVEPNVWVHHKLA